MINFSENIESLEEIILGYLLCVDEESVITDESNIEVDRGKLIGVLKPDFFTVQFYNVAFKYIKKFYSDYNKAPNIDELIKIFQLKNEVVDESKIESLKNVRISVYVNEFIYKYIKAFLMVRVLNSQINKVSIKLKTETPDPDNINSIIDYVRSELSDKIDVEITNSGNGLSIYNIDDHVQKNKQTKSTGIEYLDLVLGGGYEPKTFVVFQGRAKIGKSMVMSNLAARAALLGNNVGIYTVELGADKYIKRVGANLFNVPSFEYEKYKTKDATENSILNESIKKYKKDNPNAGEIDIKEAPTGSASVLDIENYYIKYERKNNKKIDVIFVDYLNLLKPSDNSLNGNMYLSIKKICEELRKIAQRNNWCIVSATQIKTSSFSSDDLGLDSTAESSGLIATVDTLFGLMGQPGSPYLKMKCIANRDGGYMNSYANFVKDMNFFRLNEDLNDYMNLGEEAVFNAENYQKYRDAPSETYNQFQYKVMQSAEKQVESNFVEHNEYNPVSIKENLEFPHQSGINDAYADDTIDTISVSALIDELPMGDVQYAQPQQVVQQPVYQQAQPQCAQPQQVVQQPVYQQAQPPVKPAGGYVPTPTSAPNYTSIIGIQTQCAQPQQVVQNAVKSDIQHNVNQSDIQTQQKQIVSSQQNSKNNQPEQNNDTSTLIVNDLNEAEKLAILQNNQVVQSIVSFL